MAYTNIDDPSAFFQTLLYTGNGTTTNNVTNTGNSNLQPDWVWIKQRSATQDHVVTDSSRDGEVASGTNLVLAPNTNEAEASSTGFGINYATNGINFDAAWAKVNASGQTYVAWQWKANGGTTASNTSGSITSTVQANTNAGFSIVTYTGNATNNATVGHGLGIAPSVIIIKDLTDGSVWGVWHKDLTDAGYRLTLSSDAATSNDSGFMGGGNRTLPTSSVFSLGAGGGGNGANAYVAYCFADVQGYSKFGKYRGNSSTDGTFVYLGFKPRWVMIKSTSAGVGWFIHDSKISSTNVIDDYFRADDDGPQGTSGTINIDFLSNGFKLRYGNNTNFSSHDYIYMAFAENPFVTSTGVPTTAR
jgi:hypothetical protein